MTLVSDDDRESHDEHYETFDNLYDEVSILLEEQIARINCGSLVANVNASQLHAVAVPQAPVVVQQSLRMPIPTFDGRYESWPKFRAMFKNLVDKTLDPPAVKLYHLDKSLLGDAAGLIDAKTINEGNYAHAWKMLEERYENKRHSIDTHIYGLLNLKRMSKENHSELRHLVDECSRHVESLKFLQQEFTGVSEQIVVHLLANSLDKETRRRWESTIAHGQLPNYDDTLKFLKDQCFVLERCEVSKLPPSQAKTLAPAKLNHQKSLALTSSEVEVKCDFCGKGHPNFTCSEFVTFRTATIKEEEQRSANEQEPSPKPELPAQQEKEQQPPQVTSATCSSVKTRPLQQVLLLIAVVDVIDKNNNPRPCRVLLDSASQAN
ncbi:uncharacterized protein LOC129721844 [Wyeomyia smithii]|uniref:uncharacterized protein LOC129721844 n=1 Tax=Wyeomyia smithii TaxID=174621 RepID=UPI002468063C|nr:uncharacterized protein LOC129721844 [Wyeomyia smithii]